MSMQPRTRRLTIIAQDPGVRRDGRMVRAEVEVPTEPLGLGPRGYRVQVVDYDASSDQHYQPLVLPQDHDPYSEASDELLLSDPRFHAQNVYAIVMRTLSRFESALGRRVSWAFQSHQVQVAPHAFADANAFYSRRDQGLMFGYFPGAGGRTIFTALSHDVVAHETTHAVLDGLRPRFTDPSSPDQAAFHEGFADIVAILSVFTLPDIVKTLLGQGQERIAPKDVTVEALRTSALLGLAEQMGDELNTMRGALRRSAELPPSTSYLRDWLEPHTRGEVFVAATLTAFLEVWTARLSTLGTIDGGYVTSRVVEEGVNAANHLLTMAIRALDYTPAVDLKFGDYLSALITADARVSPDDTKYGYRDLLRRTFASYGIEPVGDGPEPGSWKPAFEGCSYDHINFEHLQRDSNEAFRFLWNNRDGLKIFEEAFTRVLSVRPTVRVGPDGFIVRDTVAEYIQILDVPARALSRLKIEKPAEMPDDTPVRLYGGGILLFNDYGRLAYQISNRITNEERQAARLQHLWDYGFFQETATRRFAEMHRERSLQTLQTLATEAWS